MTHQGQTPGQAVRQDMAIKKNIPQNAPITLDPNAPPSAEFEQMAQAMDNPKPQIQPKPISPPPDQLTRTAAFSPQEEVKIKDKRPLHLTYKWEGQCGQCSNTCKTIVVKNTAIAWCMNCDEQRASKEIHPIEENINLLNENGIKMAEEIRKHSIESKPYEVTKEKMLEPVEERKVKNGTRKRSKPVVIQHKAPLQDEVPASRLQPINRESVPSQS